jgi:PhnO protein
MIIRFANEKDSKSIHQFICALEERDFDYTVFEQYFATNISNKDNIYLVAVNETDLVIGYLSCHGQILLHHLSKVFEIQELFVMEEYRNRKVGQLLIKKLEEQLSNSCHKFLEVTTNLKRLNTHRFYSKCGFEKTHLKFTKSL